LVTFTKGTGEYLKGPFLSEHLCILQMDHKHNYMHISECKSGGSFRTELKDA